MGFIFMLGKTDIEKEIALKSFLLLAIASLLTAVFFEQRGLVLAGIITGFILGSFRFSLLAKIICGVVSKGGTSAGLLVPAFCAAGLVFVAAALAAALLLSFWFFIGFAGGVLIIPLTITLFGAAGKIGTGLAEDRRGEVL